VSSRSVARSAAAVVIAASALAACGSEAETSGDEFAFAVVVEQSGPFAAYGAEVVAGVKAAVKDVNARGDLDVTLKPKFYDCQSDQAICVSQVRTAVTADKMPVVLGPTVSVTTLPTAEVTQQLDVPHLVFSVVPQLTEDYTNTYRWAASNHDNARASVDYVVGERKAERVAIVHANTEIGQAAAEDQIAALEEYDQKAVAEVAHDPGQKDYTSQLLKLKNADPDVILSTESDPSDVASLLRQSKELGIEATWVGADIAGATKLAGDAATGYVTYSPWYADNAEDENAAELAEKLKAEGADNPSWVGAVTYDATLGLAEVVGQGNVSKDDIAKGLDELADFKGTAVPSWSFGAKDHDGLDSPTFAEWDGTRYRTVWRP